MGDRGSQERSCSSSSPGSARRWPHPSGWSCSTCWPRASGASTPWPGPRAWADDGVDAPADPAAGRAGPHPQGRHDGPLPAGRRRRGRPLRGPAGRGRRHLADVDRAPRGTTSAATTPTRWRTSATELLRRARSGDVVVLDVRPRQEYAAGHIPGAVSVPLDELEHGWPSCPPTSRSSPTAAAPTACSPTTRSGC